MARLLTVDPGQAGGIRGLLLRVVRWQYKGYVPGVARLMLVDLTVARGVNTLYNHLQLRKGSPLTRLQREMLATVVNGTIGGAP